MHKERGNSMMGGEELETTHSWGGKGVVQVQGHELDSDEGG